MFAEQSFEQSRRVIHDILEAITGGISPQACIFLHEDLGGLKWDMPGELPSDRTMGTI
jgi:hypothetical protein